MRNLLIDVAESAFVTIVMVIGVILAMVVSFVVEVVVNINQMWVFIIVVLPCTVACGNVMITFLDKVMP